ncbi:MAG TPA: hypothetical protein VK760_00260 [Candidatus Acidoferrales bacterium]|jgi:hypothetical protein|nr:hypothetical protein [Candidatus Acidoferrales bacterium]
MRSFALVFSGLAAVALAACSTQNHSASGAALPPSQMSQAAPARTLHPHSPYEVSISNDDATRKLHVWNTYGGQCMSKEFPRVELDPGAKWTGVLDSVTSGWCFFTSNEQDILYWYTGEKTGNYNELDYHKPATSQLWFVDRIGGHGGFHSTSLHAPMHTHCQMPSHVIICSVGNS